MFRFNVILFLRQFCRIAKTVLCLIAIDLLRKKEESNCVSARNNASCTCVCVCRFTLFITCQCNISQDIDLIWFDFCSYFRIANEHKMSQNKNNRDRKQLFHFECFWWVNSEKGFYFGWLFVIEIHVSISAF